MWGNIYTVSVDTVYVCSEIDSFENFATIPAIYCCDKTQNEPTPFQGRRVYANGYYGMCRVQTNEFSMEARLVPRCDATMYINNNNNNLFILKISLNYLVMRHNTPLVSY